MEEPTRQFNLLILSSILMLMPSRALAQSCGTGVSLPRTLGIAGAFAVAEGTAIAIAHDTWWDTPSRSFHFQWGGTPSAGQDLLIHAAIGYRTARTSPAVFRWACFSPNTSAWLGAVLGVAVGLPKEIGDGLHEDKGFSGTDMLATVAGSLMPAAHATWGATRIVTLKTNYWPSDEYRNRVGGVPRLENDYAGQRYFLSINPSRMPGNSHWPKWLGVAIGHGVPHWITIPPVNDWYLTTDLEFRGIPVRAEWWLTIATFLDQIHFPSPGLRLRQGDIEFGLF